MDEKDRRPHDERRAFVGIVRLLVESDLVSITPILETWLKDRNTGAPIPEEVAEDLEFMRKSLEDGNERKYFVAEELGTVVGVIGMRPPIEEMKKFVTTPNPIELINAYVAKDERVGRGVGSRLFAHAEEVAKNQGNTEIVFNSGPRYEQTAWEFYDKHLPGYTRIGLAVGLFGPGGDAPVWGKQLATEDGFS